MGCLVLRLAGPVQSWAGYRLLANVHLTPSAPVPRKSAVAGLVGACLGSRELDGLMSCFDLHVRVDRDNPMASDFQVVGPLPPAIKPHADRAEKIRQVNVGRGVKVPDARNGGNFPTGTTLRGFLPHCEFVVTLTTDDETAATWLDAFKTPRFMPYLGRRANPPTWPFVLGTSRREPVSLLSELPRVRSHADHNPAGDTAPRSVRLYEVVGDYQHHDHIPLGEITPPAETREGQLTWVSQHLKR